MLTEECVVFFGCRQNEVWTQTCLSADRGTEALRLFFGEAEKPIQNFAPIPKPTSPSLFSASQNSVTGPSLRPNAVRPCAPRPIGGLKLYQLMGSGHRGVGFGPLPDWHVYILLGGVRANGTFHVWENMEAVPNFACRSKRAPSGHSESGGTRLVQRGGVRAFSTFPFGGVGGVEKLLDF